jgi:hypothetical protein
VPAAAVWKLWVGAFNFAQTPFWQGLQICLDPMGLGYRAGGVMAILNKDKHKEYSRFAAHCLEMVASTQDQEVRRVQREMAAEWMTLANAALCSSKIRAPK